MRENELPSMVQALKAGHEKGGFPDWMLEYGKNLLDSCDPNGVLFTGSHADTAGAWYLQYVENFRKDITVVPIGLLNESWFLKILMKGNRIYKNRISMSDRRTSDTDVSIHSGPILFPLTAKIRKKYGFKKDEHVLEWTDREKLLSLRGSYLRENILAMIDFIQMNRWKREIFFTLDCNKSWMRQLEPYFQMSGIVFRLLPVKCDGRIPIVDMERTVPVLLSSKNFESIRQMEDNYRVELYSVRFNYIALYLHAARFYDGLNRKPEYNSFLDRLKSICTNSILFRPEITEWMQKVENSIE
jgi:hypothetical protein